MKKVLKPVQTSSNTYLNAIVCHSCSLTIDIGFQEKILSWIKSKWYAREAKTKQSRKIVIFRNTKNTESSSGIHACGDNSSAKKLNISLQLVSQKQEISSKYHSCLREQVWISLMERKSEKNEKKLIACLVISDITTVFQ